MAKMSMIVKARRKRERVTRAVLAGKKPKKPTEAYNDCQICGRTRGIIGFFAACRMCTREMLRRGEVVGAKKSSW
jgi:ribosomal protein S14